MTNEITSTPPSNKDVLELYNERIKAAKASLLNDVELWLSTELGSTKADRSSMIRHHVKEFSLFIHGALKNFEEQIGLDANDWERADFRALVVGMLTTRWILLRETASQRVVGSPYCDKLNELDELTAGYYFCIRQVIKKLAGEEVVKQMLPFAPRICLGRLAEITIFNRNVPLILSVPLGAIFDEKNTSHLKNPNRLAIAHEIGHAFLLQFPELIEQVKEQLQTQWVQSKGQEAPRRMITLRKMMLNWCEEILADMIGTAVAGPDFAESAFIVMATSEAIAGMTDGAHPPAPVRPFTHITVLDYIAHVGTDVPEASALDEKARSLRVVVEKGLTDAQTMNLPVTVDQIKNRATNVFEAQLSRQFKSLSALAFVTLAMVRDELIDMIAKILNDIKPPVLGKEQNVGSFLVECYKTAKPTDSVEELVSWGTISPPSDDFALEFSFRPETLVAGSRSNEILCTLFGLTCS